MKKKYEADLKVQVVLGLISEKMSLSEICRKYNISQQVVSRWKVEFLKKAADIFQTKKDDKNEKNKKIEDLERMIGKLTMQLDILALY